MGSVPIFLSKVLGAAAALCLAAMVLLTVADVLLRAFFNYPLRGMLELIELGLAGTVFLGLPAVFLRDANLVVDVVDQLARASMVRLLRLLGALLSLALLAVMAWQMLPLARGMYEFGDVTSDLSIPKIYYWIPVLLGVVASAAASLVLILRWRRRP
jgi:TRAP-type C4-dicarboxylate transport system permease small subunit